VVSSASDGAPISPDDADGRRPQVLVLGGGFAGIGAARKLKEAGVDVTLVDWHDYHTFQPLLYQVATDLLETSACGHALRDLFHEQPHVAVHQATVTGIDLAGREVTFAEMAPITYDYLVLGLGARVNFFGVQGTEQNAFPMYTLADAMRLRDHVLRRWEAADKDPALVADGALNVVIVGGGPTGIESAGALAELYRSNFAEDYPGIDQDQARIVLVEAGAALMPMFKSDIRSYTKKALEKRGVEVLLGEVVTSVEPTRVTLESGTVIKAHTLVWGAGLQASPLVASLGIELQHGDRIPVEPDLSVAGHPEVFAVGDIAWITDVKTNDVLPQLGSVALQAGEQAGENIARLVAGKDTEPFEYHDKGTMATIGRGTAVVQTRGGHTIKGKGASLAWGAVHLALLSTGEDRAKAVVDWTWAGFTHERGGRISVKEDQD
jgi:NADH:ubiquinone reductase (H+-translocating)